MQSELIVLGLCNGLIYCACGDVIDVYNKDTLAIRFGSKGETHGNEIIDLFRKDHPEFEGKLATFDALDTMITKEICKACGIVILDGIPLSKQVRDAYSVISDAAVFDPIANVKDILSKRSVGDAFPVRLRDRNDLLPVLEEILKLYRIELIDAVDWMEGETRHPNDVVYYTIVKLIEAKTNEDKKQDSDV